MSGMVDRLDPLARTSICLDHSGFGPQTEPLVDMERLEVLQGGMMMV